MVGQPITTIPIKAKLSNKQLIDLVVVVVVATYTTIIIAVE